MRFGIPGINSLAHIPQSDARVPPIEQQRWADTAAEGVLSDLQNPFVQVDHMPLAKNEVEVFQTFREPETLHAVRFPEWRLADVNNSGVSNICSCSLIDALEHLPSNVAQLNLACDAI
jgi:hypothetical protein